DVLRRECADLSADVDLKIHIGDRDADVVALARTGDGEQLCRRIERRRKIAALFQNFPASVRHLFLRRATSASPVNSIVAEGSGTSEPRPAGLALSGEEGTKSMNPP